MTSLLQMGVPVSTAHIQFDVVCRGDVDALLRLSAARRRMAADVVAAVAKATGVADDRDRLERALASVNVYRRLWLDFVDGVQRQGTKATTAVPMDFVWEWQPFEGDASVDASLSTPFAETVAVELSVAALEQRLSQFDPSASARARAALERLLAASDWSPVLNDPPERSSAAASTAVAVAAEVRPRLRVSALMNPVRWAALVDAIGGQQSARDALSAAAAHESAATVAAHFFAAARQFRRASERVPTSLAVRQSMQRSTALGYRWAATALVDGRHEWGGHAVALAQLAARVDPANEHVRTFAADMQRRNEIEFGLQAVPANLRVVFEARGERQPAVTVGSDDDESATLVVVAM